MQVLHILFHSEPIETGYSIRSKQILENLKKVDKENEHIALTSSYQSQIEFTDGKRNQYIRTDKYKSSIIKNMFYLYMEIRRFSKNNQLDLIHIHSPWLIALPAVLFSKFYKIPSVYEIRGAWEETDVALGKLDTNSIKYKLIKKIEDFCMKNVNERICISLNLIEDLQKRIGKEYAFFHIPNGVELEGLKLQKKNHGVDKEVTIGYISSIRKLEGIQTLIHSVKFLQKYSLFPQVYIVGEGNYLNELKDLTKQLGLTSQIVFTGRINHEEISKYYETIDIFVIPRTNTKVNHIVTPLKPYEALAYGKSIVASDVGGLKEIFIDNHDALFFRSDSEEDLAKILKELISNKQKREELERNALTSAKKSAWSNVVYKYHDVYDKFKISNNIR